MARKNVCNVSVSVKTDPNGRPIETLEALLRRFKKKVEKSNLLYDLRSHDYYVKPSVKKKLKSKMARQRIEREAAKKQKYLDKKLDK